MQLLSLSFLYFGLPLGLLACYLAPRRLRPGALLALSLLYFCAAQPQALPLLACSVTMDYLALQLMQRFDGNSGMRRAVLAFSVAKTLLVILYAGFIVQWAGGEPVLGAAVYTLLGLDCILAAYRREFTPVNQPVTFALYCCFFPRLYAGPLQTAADFSGQMEQMGASPALLLDGVGKFLTGAVKVLLFGGYLSAMYQTLYDYVQAEPNVLALWCAVTSLALMIFYRFSGYCDMAAGIAMMFGFRLPQSFYFPYQSRGLLDFFQRFHSTLWVFLERSLYTALGRGKRGPAADTLAMLLLGMLFGAWFELRVGTIAWGGSLALFAAAEKHLFPMLRINLPVLFRRLYNVVVVLLSFGFFMGGTLGQGWAYIRGLLFFPEIEFQSYRTLYILSTNWVLLLFAVFFAANPANLLSGLLKKASPRAHRVLALAGDAALLAVVTALLS